MGAINAMLRGFRALKNLNTGGRSISGLASKESWIRPMQVNLETGEMGRKVKNGVSLKEAHETLGLKEGEKIIGSASHNKGPFKSSANFFIKDANNNIRHANKQGIAFAPEYTKKFLKREKDSGNFNYTPVRYDTDALTKKSKAILGAGVGYGGYEGYKYLSSDSEDNNKSANVIANAAKLNSSQNNETASNTENNSKNRFIKAVSGQLRTPEQEADPERDLPYYAKSGQGQADPIQPPKAKTNVKPKKSANLNYDPIAEWAKADQAINDKWLKRQADYKKLVDEGVDPYDAYDRTINLYN